jgi:predicted metalloendopeptidase
MQLVGDFFATAMDSAKIEADGIAPLKKELQGIDALASPADVQAKIAEFHTMYIGVPFTVFVNQDDKNSTQVIAQLYQAGLGLPDRDYYTKDDADSKALREKYVAHVTRMLVLAGEEEAVAAKHAATVLEMETRLAKASMTRVEQRDPEKVYHKMTVAELAAAAPGFDWKSYFAGIGLPNPEYLNVAQPDFMKEIGAMMTSVPVEDWKTYLRWHGVSDAADLLSSSFVNERFEFYGKTLNGQKELRPRWKRVLGLIDNAVGEALGQLFVEKYFPAKAKSRAKELVENLRVALADRIQKLEWMSDATKKEAIRKLNAFGVKIGYPDKWQDYTGLQISRDSYFQNAVNASKFEFRRQINKVGKPVDRTEWGMTPPTVNAYYNPTMNEIVFPAGILQPPFFDAEADDAVNYGGIGAVIGHEMTHGFDDQGRQYNAEGNLKDWWTDDDAKKYTERADVIKEQFNNYVALDTLRVNGDLTLGENIADLGGLTVAYHALEMALAKSGKPGKIDGFTPEQRFFLSWAQVWRQNIRPENLKVRLITDPHSPGRFRAIGPLSNMDEFLAAFDVDDGAPMARPKDKRAKIW